MQQKDLNKRYSQMPDAILISSFLHPRTKQLNFISNEQREQVHETVTSELLDYVTGQSNVSETLQSLISNTDQTSATDHANDFMDWIDNIIEPEDTHTSPEGIRDQITRELQRYIA